MDSEYVFEIIQDEPMNGKGMRSTCLQWRRKQLIIGLAIVFKEKAPSFLKQCMLSFE